MEDTTVFITVSQTRNLRPIRKAHSLDSCCAKGFWNGWVVFSSNVDRANLAF